MITSLIGRKFSFALAVSLLGANAVEKGALALAGASVSPARAISARRAEAVKYAVADGERVWTAVQDPDKHNPWSRDFFAYALALCEAKVHPERLEKLFEIAAHFQDRDPQSPTYGSFRWNWADKAVRDANAIEFCMQPAAVVWLKHRDTLPAAAREKLREILDPAVKASLRHRVSDGYTNIALMSAGNLILLGEGLGREDVADEGYQRLQAVFASIANTGIREYVSPSYCGVDLDALQLIDAFCQRPAGQRQARALVELFWTDIAANFWWANRRLCGAHSRDYDYLHSQGGLDRNPYGKSKIPWRGHLKAVHLQPFFAGVQETQDALGLVVYRDKDVPADSTTLESHLVMPREVEAIYLEEQKVDFLAGTPRTIGLKAGEAVFLRRGTAALAVRVPVASTCDGKAAPVALVWDDNEWGAIRLTVDHRKTDQPPKVSAAAVFQVRVGSELSEAAFARFLCAFSEAKCDVSLEPNRISLRSPAANKTLSIMAASPWAKPSRLEPAPPRAILSIDGEDLGRKLLEAAR